MFLEILVAISFGVIAGIFTGMIPGIHINLISTIVVSSIHLLYDIASPQQVVIFIMSMSITHTFIDSIPSIYLGAPDPSQFLTALPGHRMFLEGKAHQAVILTLLGSLFSLLFSLLLLGYFSIILDDLYDLIDDKIGYMLLAISFYLIVDVTSLLSSLKRAFFFMISGAYGILIFEISALDNPMFHMLSGLFGISILVESLSSSSLQIDQDLSSFPDSRPIIPAFMASIAGFFAAFMPGFSTSQNAVIMSRVFRRISEWDFMMILGGLNTSGMLASLGSFYILERARNGSVVAVQNVIGSIDFDMFLIAALSLLISGTIAVAVALRLSRLMSRLTSMIDPSSLAIAVILLIVSLSLIFDGLLGIVVLSLCTITGICTSRFGVAKNYLMGCIILPVILFFVL